MMDEAGSDRGVARNLITASLRLLRSAISGVVSLVLALVLLFEEWGWRPLLAALGWLARFRIVARIEAGIASLPPWAALIVFAAPSLLLFPVKIAGLWLLSQGKVIAAGGLLAVAKVASTALVARIFMLTRPALMQLVWFARLYNRFVPWKEALFASIRASFVWRYGRMLKTKVRQAMRRLFDRVRPRVAEVLTALRLRARVTWRRWFGARSG